MDRTSNRTFYSQRPAFKEPVLNVQAVHSCRDTRFYEYMSEAYNDYLEDSSIWGIAKGKGNKDRWIKVTKANYNKTY
jgi:hypothetical protein